MNEANRMTPFLLVSLLIGCLLFPHGLVQEVQAEPSAAEDALAAEGLTLVAFRNDTMDMNQDGEPDSIRVVVLNGLKLNCDCTAFTRIKKFKKNSTWLLQVNRMQV